MHRTGAVPSSGPDVAPAASGGIGRRLVLAGLVALLVALQVRLWTGKGSLAEISELQGRLETRRAENRRLTEHNVLLEAEVRALKADPDAVEGRARSELGMIRDGETFYLILGDEAVGGPTERGPAERGPTERGPAERGPTAP